jgi:hypothetical protein
MKINKNLIRLKINYLKMLLQCSRQNKIKFLINYKHLNKLTLNTSSVTYRQKKKDQNQSQILIFLFNFNHNQKLKIKLKLMDRKN